MQGFNFLIPARDVRTFLEGTDIVPGRDSGFNAAWTAGLSALFTERLQAVTKLTEANTYSLQTKTCPSRLRELRRMAGVASRQSADSVRQRRKGLLVVDGQSKALRKVLLGHARCSGSAPAHSRRA